MILAASSRPVQHHEGAHRNRYWVQTSRATSGVHFAGRLGWPGGAGLTRDEVARVADGPEAGGGSERDRLLLRVPLDRRR